MYEVIQFLPGIREYSFNIHIAGTPRSELDRNLMENKLNFHPESIVYQRRSHIIPVFILAKDSFDMTISAVPTYHNSVYIPFKRSTAFFTCKARLTLRETLWGAWKISIVVLEILEFVNLWR